jgi:Calcineurin-like phosphoesterase
VNAICVVPLSPGLREAQGKPPVGPHYRSSDDLDSRVEASDEFWPGSEMKPYGLERRSMASGTGLRNGVSRQTEDSIAISVLLVEKEICAATPIAERVTLMLPKEGEPMKTPHRGLTQRRRAFGCMIGLGLLFAASSCVPPPQPSLSSTYEILYGQPVDADPVTGGIVLIADSHYHYLLGKPTFFQTRFTDAKFSSSAIRSPQLDLFGEDFLQEALDREMGSGHAEALVHMGDGLDFACDAEWAHFLAQMSASNATWVMTPGNHDAFFFGNFDAENTADDWKASCSKGGEPIRKDRFIELYLQALANQPKNTGLRAVLSPKHDNGEWHCGAGSPSCQDTFLQDVVWRLDHTRPSRSFVTQRVNLGYSRVPATRPMASVDGILIDTAQYERSVGLEIAALEKAAGKMGQILDDQRNVVDGWIKDAKSKQRVVIPMGHHPYGELDEHSRGLVDSIMMNSPFYVSAHTHDGRYLVHGKTADGWMELNLGSILDWPPNYRLLSFFRRPDGRVGARAWYRAPEGPIKKVLAECPVGNQWEARPTDPDFFVSYTTLSGLGAFDYIKTQRLIFDVLLSSLQRMFRCVPEAGSITVQPAEPGQCAQASPHDAAIESAKAQNDLDVKANLLRELMALAADPNHFQQKELWSQYRYCQAEWASHYEHEESRLPAVRDEYFLLPEMRASR